MWKMANAFREAFACFHMAVILPRINSDEPTNTSPRVKLTIFVVTSRLKRGTETERMVEGGGSSRKKYT